MEDDEGQQPDGGAPDEPEDDNIVADFEYKAWAPSDERYGIHGLLQLREAMQPIEKPNEVAHLKFLICPTAGGATAPEEPAPRERGKEDRRNNKNRGKEKEKAGGYNKTQGPQSPGGRYIPEMGRTETVATPPRGQWWRNIGDETMDVIVRESFSLASAEIGRIPSGHYVQQAGLMEVFVNGQAQGLQRMPVQPRGWVTVDATSVGGPKYMSPISSPVWKVIFSSGSNKGDIVVRENVSLDSDEVAVLICGTLVEQNGPSELLEDGIIRMPIAFFDTAGREASSPSQPARKKAGWVTCDATSQGGPKFFEPAPADEVPLQAAPAKAPEKRNEKPSQKERSVPASPGAEAEEDGAAAGGSGNSWDKNRIWKVCNLEAVGSKQLAVVCRAEPYAPGTGKVPPEDTLVRWLAENDVVEQVGHSKKMRGYMVMPIRITESQSTVNPAAKPARPEGGQKVDGWVTRRLVDKTREQEVGVWFQELTAGEDQETRERRRQARSQRQR